MKVERIYVIFNDDCHEYLIDYEYYNAFENEYVLSSSVFNEYTIL